MYYRRKDILNHFSCGEKFKVRSGINKIFLAIGFALLLAPIALSIKNNVFASRLEVNIAITSFNLSKDGNQITVLDEASASENLTDYPVKMSHNTPTNLELVFDLNVTGGRTVSSGDTVLIPFTTHYLENNPTTFDLILDDFSEAMLYDGSTNIGTFKKVDSGEGIIIEFNRNAAGASSFTDLTLVMNNAVRSAALGYARVGYVTVASQKYYFGIVKKSLGNLSDVTYTSEVTNDSVSWETRIGTDLTNELSTSRGTSGTPVNTVVEQAYPGAVDHGPLTIFEAHRMPLNLNSDAPSGHKAAESINHINDFTQITQNAGESYASFKARVVASPLRYGFYKDSDGLRLVVNYGLLGVDTPFGSANTWAESAADAAIAQGYYTAADKQALIDYYIACFGDNSVISQVPSPAYSFRAIYPVAYEDTPVSSTAVVTYGNTSVTLTDSATLVGIFGSVKVQARAMQVVTVDYESRELISGGTYKLQIKHGDIYEDYTPNDGGTLIRTVADGGMLTFSNLGIGTYRLVEVSVPEGYDPTLTDGYDEIDEVAYSSDFVVSASDTEGTRIIVYNLKSDKSAEADEDAPAVPKTGANTTDGLGGTIDASVCAMTAIGIAMIVIAIKKKVSIE
ncbi:MAG: prealbumin-like fold domain-containing protein [Candidatus Saccharibacteria bacterium]|nr:prealbumin-like fold domain-containing protein [Candidatus Saccharibacteria bacterium]